MENLSTFCSCTNLACPLHPTKHDKGCAPCIQKNLRLKEMPNCFFNLVEGTENMIISYCLLKTNYLFHNK